MSTSDMPILSLLELICSVDKTIGVKCIELLGRTLISELQNKIWLIRQMEASVEKPNKLI